jgi:hypothetical protein
LQPGSGFRGHERVPSVPGHFKAVSLAVVGNQSVAEPDA